MELNYDVKNRLSRNGAGQELSYGPDNRRVWDGTAITFWSVAGYRVGRYQPTQSGGSWVFTTLSTSLYLEGRLIGEGGTASQSVNFKAVVTDRLGSVRVRDGQGYRYFPYGEEMGTQTGNGVDKFGTYRREDFGNNQIDYADQRYHMPGWGRFGTPDPTSAADPTEPTSWNQFAYVGGDPVNLVDPEGLTWQFVSSGTPSWALPEHNPATVGLSTRFIFLQFHWTGSGPASIAPPLSFVNAIRMAPRVPGVEQFRQLSSTSVALEVVNRTHPLEHARNILRGFRKYFDDHWSDPCGQWLAGGRSRGAFRGQMDRIIDNMRSGRIIEFSTTYGSQDGIWTSTLHGWFETYNGNHIMMNRNVESFGYGLSLRNQQTSVLHELGHVFSAQGIWMNDGAYKGLADQHPNNRLVVEKCGHLLGQWFHGR